MLPLPDAGPAEMARQQRSYSDFFRPTEPNERNKKWKDDRAWPERLALAYIQQISEAGGAKRF